MKEKVVQSQIRVMRVLVIYDLPSLSKKHHKNYSLFHNFLLKNGFYMLQESIYCCLARNHHFTQLIIEKVGKNSPDLGDVRCFAITEKQYQNIKIFTGKKSFQEKIISLDPLLEI